MLEAVQEMAINTTPVPPEVWKRYVDDSFCIIKRNTVNCFHTTLNAIDQHIPFTMKKIITRSLFGPYGYSLSLWMYIENPPILIDIWLPSPTMKNDSRSVQLTLFCIVQLNSKTRNKEKRLNSIMSLMLYELTIILKISSQIF